jgi:hypothetical protein
MRQGSLAGPVIVAIGVVAAAIAFAVVTTLLDTADSTTDLRLTRIEAALVAEEAARRALADELVQAKSDLARLREEMSLRVNQGAATVVAPPPAIPAPEAGFDPGADENFELPETEAPTEIMLLARTRFNRGITQPRNRTMLEILGHPRDSYGTDCQTVTNTRLANLIETRQVGPIRVMMLRPALDSLERIMARLQQNEPDLFAKLGTAGALCARLIRGSSTGISNHSWGTAIDLTLAGELDGFGDGGTQLGLVILAEYFNDEGWFWGATYGREDSMHFEIGEEVLRAWVAEGLL